MINDIVWSQIKETGMVLNDILLIIVNNNYKISTYSVHIHINTDIQRYVHKSLYTNATVHAPLNIMHWSYANKK